VNDGPDEPRLRGLRPRLLRWYRRNRRELPWRRTRDPWAVWVAEIMLQQTRVDRVVDYYDRFLRRFPDPAALAGADEDAVLALWSGLGYYRRARALRAAAVSVMERHGGRVPDDPAALLALPGVGRYTAGAVASIAFDRPEPVLDGNVRRVLSRLLGFDAGAGAGAGRRAWSAAAALVRGPAPGDLNQALMELGAMVCAPRAPRCDACPVAGRCAALATGDPARYPAPRPGRPVETVAVAVAVVRRAGRLLLARRDADGPLRGAWDLPAVAFERDSSTDDDTRPAAEALVAAVARRHGLRLRPGRRLAAADHGIMHRKLRLEAFDCRLLGGGVAGRDGLRWIAPGSLHEVAVSGATLKLVGRLPHGASTVRGAQMRSHGGTRSSSSRSGSGSGSIAPSKR